MVRVFRGKFCSISAIPKLKQMRGLEVCKVSEGYEAPPV